ncbi:Hypothetical protein MALK_6410 [Metamycoplasma alkalescens 14918]|uniref:Uncharacterized protein n=1 Tax=Metamycoplasma alkalescens 14918 TaxID=1188234 RepID=N9U9U1_9BACT|nr:hypothetical protein [Metamycoplasma alkalescens]ENY53693.1 Hypothetical protein MALK_6410 [Metamycoplasma alkalescens 14918]
MGWLIKESDVKYLFENRFGDFDDEEIWEIFHYFVLRKKEDEVDKKEFCDLLKQINFNFLKLEKKFKSKILDELFQQKMDLNILEQLNYFVCFLITKNPKITFVEAEQIINIGFWLEDFLKENNIFNYKSLILLIDQDLRKNGIYSNWIWLINPVIASNENYYFQIEETKTKWNKLSSLDVEASYKNWLIKFDFEKMLF